MSEKDAKESYDMAQKAHLMSKDQMKMMLERETGPTDRFSSSFGRHLEYYTGLVFKIDIKSKSEKLNIRGGRYDSLIKDLGFKKNIPAVGAAINLEKI